jgi:hypothetical protein
MHSSRTRIAQATGRRYDPHVTLGKLQSCSARRPQEQCWSNIFLSRHVLAVIVLELIPSLHMRVHIVV